MQVDFRPVTQHGMVGMRSGANATGRQYADKAFFLAEIRNKITQVREEHNKLSNEIEERQRDQNSVSEFHNIIIMIISCSDLRILQHGHLERSHQSLAEEVHQLEGQLADFNLAHDKVG